MAPACTVVSAAAVLDEAKQALGAQALEVEAALPPSVAEMSTAAGQPGPLCQTLLLVSSGHGDLRLLLRQAGGVTLSAAVYPLRPPAPLQGVRPFFLEAAVQVAEALVLCTESALLGSSPLLCQAVCRSRCVSRMDGWQFMVLCGGMKCCSSNIAAHPWRTS